MSVPCHSVCGYTDIVPVRQGQQHVSGLERVRWMGRISVPLELSRVHSAGCLGETGYMDSSFVDAFVKHIFTSSLGLFVHYKASPNTGDPR